MASISEHIEYVKSLRALPPEQRSYDVQLMDMKFSDAAFQIGYGLAVSYVEYLNRLDLATNGKGYKITETYAAFRKAEAAERFKTKT